jgi:sorting nexin-1/2
MAAPTSPNPSFNSLQARPTPPATSGRNSPESSRSRHSLDAQQTPDDAASQTTEAPSTVVNGDGEPKAADPLAPGAAPPSRSASSDVGRRSTSHLPALAAPRDGPDLVAPEDGDSDGYGQPSPRESSHDAFPGGYGEVTFGLASEASTSHDVPAPSARTDAVEEEAAPARPWFVVKVGDPQKKGDPMTAHIVYTVRTKVGGSALSSLDQILTALPQTSANYFRSQQFSVLRRYSDFRWLHAALVHNNPGVFIPPVPEKVRLARFAPELVEARRHGLENCINKIANHALLQDDEDLRLFLHSDNFAADVKLRDIRKGPVPTPEQKTYFGWSSSMSAPKFHEFDEVRTHCLPALVLQLMCCAVASGSMCRRSTLIILRAISSSLSRQSMLCRNSGEVREE